VCISWNNKSVFDIIDARCKREDHLGSFVQILVSENNMARPHSTADRLQMVCKNCPNLLTGM
jgi:hypothetical protein